MGSAERSEERRADGAGTAGARGDGAAGTSASAASSTAETARRPVYNVDKLPASRELMVYEDECVEEALLCSIDIGTSHTIGDVHAMVGERLEWEVSGATLYRGTAGESVRVPLHAKQYGLAALPFFPLDSHNLVVGRPR